MKLLLQVKVIYNFVMREAETVFMLTADKHPVLDHFCIENDVFVDCDLNNHRR